MIGGGSGGTGWDSTGAAGGGGGMVTDGEFFKEVGDPVLDTLGLLRAKSGPSSTSSSGTVPELPSKDFILNPTR